MRFQFMYDCAQYWQMSMSLLVGVELLLLEVLAMFGCAMRAPLFSIGENPFDQLAPCLMQSLNRHAALYFVLANIITGIYVFRVSGMRYYTEECPHRYCEHACGDGGRGADVERPLLPLRIHARLHCHRALSACQTTTLLTLHARPHQVPNVRNLSAISIISSMKRERLVRLSCKCSMLARFPLGHST